MGDDGEILEDTGDLLSTPFTSTYDPATWENVCDDFLDPLADQLDRWIDRRPSHEAADLDVIHWLEKLTYIVHAIATGVGSQDDCSRWNRAKTELAIEVSAALAAQFETRAKRLFGAANAAVDEFSTCRPKYASAVVNGLLDVEVGEFRDYLENVGRTLRRPSEREAKKNAGSGDVPKPIPAAETVDTEGYVTNPSDPTAYVPANEVLRNHTPVDFATTYKQWRRILDKHPEIRRWQRHPQRLSVHLADWTKYVRDATAQVDAEGFVCDPIELEERKKEVLRLATEAKRVNPRRR